MERWFSRRAAKPFCCHNTLTATAYQLIYTTLYLCIKSGHYFGGWVEGPSKQTDWADGGWVQSTFGAKAEEIYML